MQRDPVDKFLEQWQDERPDLDPSPLAVVSRLLMLYPHLEHSADQALRRFHLSLWQFDVLAALRRSGAPFSLSPSRLTQLVTLSAGAMTNRIDRLEQLGLVRRGDDPGDRRGLRVSLTRKGRRLVDEAIVVRLDDARRNIARLTPAEVRGLAGLLRKLLSAVTNGATRVSAPPKRKARRDASVARRGSSGRRTQGVQP
jgi:DNA-binding MarR family transcriptional regulator